MVKGDGMVFIGKKPLMSYVLAVVTQFSTGSDVRIKARGKSISKAVDVAEIVRNRFVQDARVEDVKIGTETIETDKNEKINVSIIEIHMKRG